MRQLNRQTIRRILREQPALAALARVGNIDAVMEALHNEELALLNSSDEAPAANTVRRTPVIRPLEQLLGAGRSLGWIAWKLGLPTKTVWRWQQGLARPNTQFLAKLTSLAALRDEPATYATTLQDVRTTPRFPGTQSFSRVPQAQAF
jgi:hypothetical protein